MNLTEYVIKAAALLAACNFDVIMKTRCIEWENRHGGGVECCDKWHLVN